MVIRNNLDILIGSEERWKGWLILDYGFSVCQSQSTPGKALVVSLAHRTSPCPFMSLCELSLPCPGYIIYYSTDVNAEIHDWVIEPVVGNRLTHQIQELTLDTPYFFKIQARNSKGMGPMSEAVQFRTPKGTRPCSPQLCSCHRHRWAVH